jgi:dTMP kinase
MYLNGDFGSDPDLVNAYAASAFFSVDRAAAFMQGLGDFYRSGGTVLCDRYTTSNAVHQAAKLPPDEQIPFVEWLFDFEYNKLGLPRPNLVIFLDMPPELSVSMIQKRGEGKDIHEADIEYLRRSSDAARRVAVEYGWKAIMCSCEDGSLRTPENIADEIAAYTLDVIK